MDTLLNLATVYSEHTGLTRQAVAVYREMPVSTWSTIVDRKIGSTLRGLDKMAKSPALTWDEWYRIMWELLGIVAKYMRGKFPSVAAFITSFAKVAKSVLDRLAELLGMLSPLLDKLIALFGEGETTVQRGRALVPAR